MGDKNTCDQNLKAAPIKAFVCNKTNVCKCINVSAYSSQDKFSIQCNDCLEWFEIKYSSLTEAKGHEVTFKI